MPKVDTQVPPASPFGSIFISEKLLQVVPQKSIPAQIREIILYISNNKG
jgi:hypothetical protein